MFKLWKNMDEDDKSRLVKATGLVIALFTLFTLFSTVSYFFTWKADQSLLTSGLAESSADASNIAGKMGFRWADLLVREWFGLGSLVLIVVLFAISVRLLLGRWHYSMPKTILLTLSGGLLISFLLAYISDLFGLGNLFGGGLGGECGESVVNWSRNLFGSFLTAFILIALVILWLFLASRRFSKWFNSLGRKMDDIMDESQPAPEPAPKPVPKPAPQPIHQPAPKPAPQPVPKPAPQPKPAPVVEGARQLEIIKGEDLKTEVTHELERINVRDELPRYEIPSLELLEEHSGGRYEVSDEELQRNNEKIRATLENYKIQINDVTAVVGPTVTLYKVNPAPGVKIAEIKRLQDDIGMYLHAKGVRVVTLTDSVGIEVANDHPSIVPMRAVLNDEAFRKAQTKMELPIAIGSTIQKEVKVFDLADAPHLLVAGATKMGKSVGLNAIIASLLYSKHPSELKLVFIDPKMVEFSAYARLLHHYLAVVPCNDEQEEQQNAIIKKAEMAEKVLKSLVQEMEDRYQLISKAYVQNVKQYNEKYRNRRLLPTDGHKFMPYIVTVIDEYADLTMSMSGGDSKAIARSITTSIIRLAQKGRAAGIHVVIATQRPSVDVITGLIKANFPTRIAFRVLSRIDSSTILDSPGAEKLIGRGDMLYYAGVEMERVQCAFIDNEEINRLTEFIGSQQGYKRSYNTPYYLPEVQDSTESGSGGMVDMKKLDDRFEEAARMIVTRQRGSTSDLQRQLGMGYAKAGRVMDQLEAAGIVGPQEGSKPRQVLISTLDELEKVLEAYRNQ
ncbi:MAG: DNA translocase FtsK 4TM domain-containing protein [Bacteroidales bacterium]|nr:DNA translocase FtsK 4TM domain-containing protein [Bacteroidales bacterium]